MIALALALCLEAAPAPPPTPGPGPANAAQLRTTWRTEAGPEVTLEDLVKEPVVLAFVYTSCTATCPLATKKLKRLDDQLGAEHRAARFVIVSLDPEHDTPAAVAAYKKQYGVEDRGSWSVLVGPEASLRTLTMLLDFRYSRNPETHVVTHDNKLFVLAPGGAVVAQSSSLNDDLRVLLDAVPQAAVPAPKKAAVQKK